MSDDPELNALADQARLALSPDKRAELVAAVHRALAEVALLADEPCEEPPALEDEPPPDDAPAADPSRAASAADKATDTPVDDVDEAPAPGPPIGLDDDVVELQEDAHERFTALSAWAREGFFVVPRVPHGQGH